MNLKSLSFPLLVPVLLSLPHATAAETGPPRAGVELAARYSHAAKSDLGFPDADGSVAVNSSWLGMTSSIPISTDTRLLFGAEWTRHDLDLEGPRRLPERLESVALPLGVLHRASERWRLLVNMQPRLASAGTELASGGFDLPLLALARYAASPDLTWTFGLRYSARSDLKLLPLVGATWQFAPKWEAALAFPESGVSYRHDTNLTLRAVAAFHGGDYRLDSDPREPAARIGGSLADAWLEYREIRIGVAAEYVVNATLTVRAGAGIVVDQRFDYFERAVEIEGSSPAYVALAIVGRF